MRTSETTSFAQRFSGQGAQAAARHPISQPAGANADRPPLIELAGAVHILGSDGQYRPVLSAPGGRPVSSINAGWRARWAYRDFAPLVLVAFDGPDDKQATWFIDATSVRLGDKVSALGPEHQQHLRAALTRLHRGADLEALALYSRLCPETRQQLEALAPMPGRDESEPLIVSAGAVHALGPDGRYRPVLSAPGGHPIPTINAGWSARWIYRDFAPLTLIEFDGPDNRRATWFVDEAGARLGDKVFALPQPYQQHLQAALVRLRGNAGAEAMARYNRLYPGTRLRLEALLPAPDPAEPGAPLIERNGAIHILGSDGRYRPVMAFPDGPPVPSLLPGWRASGIYQDFAPLRLVEFEGPNEGRAIWFVDADDAKLGDTVSALPKKHQDALQAAVAKLLADKGTANPEARARYNRICPATRLQLEALLPNAAYDRALELGQAIAAAAATALRTAVTVTPFAAASAGLPPELAEGWRVTELDGRPICVATGRRSVIRFQNVPRSKGYCVTLLAGRLRMSRRLRVIANGRLIAINPLSDAPYLHKTFARFSYWIPPELVSSNVIELTLEHETIATGNADAFGLQNVRLDIGEPVAGTETALTDDELMLRFQSLGDNCQFGFIQRHFGVEPMGLLRFAGVHDLIQLLDSSLEGLGDPGTVTYYMAGNEFMIRENRYGVFYHTWKEPDTITAEELIAENEVKLRYLKRMFLEDLEEADQIWITRRIVSNDIQEIFALHAALRRYGPNKLLWITPAPPDRQPGDVEWLAPDLLKGYLAADAHNGPRSFNADHWLWLCRNAYRVFQER